MNHATIAMATSHLGPPSGPPDPAAARSQGPGIPAQELARLIEHRLHPDAVLLVAGVLPRREAVWWACRCVRLAHGPNPPAAVAAALQAAERWAADPSEDHRRAAFTAAGEAGFGTPAGCAAVSAFWSGGSLGPPNVPAIPPAEHLTARGVAGAVQLAAVLTEPEKAEERYRRFFALAKDVADGTDRWPEAKPAPSPQPRETNHGPACRTSR